MAQPSGLPGGPPQEIVDLVRAGHKIGAIKLHRQLYGSSLIDAKNAIDSLGVTRSRAVFRPAT